MAALDQRQTEVIQSRADEKWVFLHDGGDAAKELLLEEQDGDASGDKENLGNAAEGQDSILDVAKFLGWCHSAWNDVHICHAFSGDIRPYVLAIALSVHTVLSLLAALASPIECEVLQAILTSLENFTMAVLCPAAFSYATRFLSLLAAQASVVKKVKVNALLLFLLGNNAMIQAAGYLAAFHGVGAGFTASWKVERQAWYLHLPLFVLQCPASIGAIWYSAMLGPLMKTDVVATYHTFALHWRETEEARTVFSRRWLHPLKSIMLAAVVTVVTIIGTVAILIVFEVIPDPAIPAASGGI